MDYRQEIISGINSFYIESIEEFREAEARIAVDSQFRRIFKKKDYGANIDLLRRCKAKANDISFPDDIPDGDTESIDIVHCCRECIRLFGRLCDSYIGMQMTLARKAQGDKVSYKEYNQTYGQTKERHARFNENVRELDILYADYAENAEDSPESDKGYLTYDMIAGGSEEE